jgi:hypothetical protein
MFKVDEYKHARSWLNDAVDRLEHINETEVLPTRSLLERIVEEPRLHARFINTLSMLEHMGSHKIMATQHRAGIDQPTLKHIAEEAHHAYFMKRQAEKTAGRPLEYVASELIAPASARMYFQRLEAGMLRMLEAEHRANATYLYMSMIVEFRALWLYRLYQLTLKHARHPLSLKRLIGEEQSHLADMAQRLELADELGKARATTFVDLETRLFKRLLASMEREIGTAAA